LIYDRHSRPAPRGASSACFPTSRTLPVYCFVDCDPYGFTNIYRTLKVGSGTAHTNRFLCVPRARFLGVGKFVGVAMTCSEVSADFHSNFLTSQTFESWQTVQSTVSSEIRIDTDQKNGGSFSKNFQRIGNQTEPAPWH
jgi:hypothetical protein